MSAGGVPTAEQVEAAQLLHECHRDRYIGDDRYRCVVHETTWPCSVATTTARAISAVRAELEDQRAARQIAGEAADRFRDNLAEALGYPDENPGDDVLIAKLREHFGRTGPEPARWREFCSGALAVVDQINAARSVR